MHAVTSSAALASSHCTSIAQPRASETDAHSPLLQLRQDHTGQLYTPSYELESSIEDKLTAIVTKIYRGSKVELTPNAKKQAKQLTEQGFGNYPICMAKTQYSFSDNASLLGAPEGFTVTVRNLKVSAGAGFIVALTGDILTMPGLPKVPAAEKIDVDELGRISGLF